MGEGVDQRPGAGERPLDALWPDDGRGGRHHRVRGVAGVARGVGGDEDRVADEVHLGRHRDVEHRPVVLAGDLVHQRQREGRLQRLERQVEHRVAVHARHLGRRVHHRSARLVLHALARHHGANLGPERRDLPGVGLGRGDRRHRQLGRQPQALVVGEPGLQRQVAARREVGRGTVQRHHRAERRRDVGDVGDDRALGGHHRVLRREQALDAEGLHEPALLVLGPVARARHRACVADGAGQLRLPAADDAGDDRLSPVDAVLVVAAGLGVEHRRLRAVVGGEGMREVGGGVVDVDVLAARDERRRAPAGRAEILGDRRREAARVREDRHRSFQQRLLGVVAAERAADPHPVPGVGDPEAVAADDVDAVRLRHRPDLAGVVHGDLLGDDDDLLQAGVDPHQLGDAVAHPRGRQVDDAGVEGVPGVEPLADVVVDRDVAGRRLQHLAGAARRGAEDDVAAGEGVARRRHLARLAAHDVEHADPVVAGRDVGQRADAEVVGDALDAALEHVSPSRQAAARTPSVAAISARPPARIQASTRLA